jgi:hypothetical protein
MAGEAEAMRGLPGVVLAKARTHHPREQFGEGWSFGIATIHNR